MEVTAAPPGPELRRRARVAGALYLLVLLTAPFVLLVLPRLLVVTRDPAATAARLRDHELLFRASVALGVSQSFLWLAVVYSLYRLLRHVGRDRARVMLLLGALVPVPIGLASEGLRLAAFVLARGVPFVSAIPEPQRDALGYLALHLDGQVQNIVSVFWGLWLFPLGSLVTSPGLAPRWVGTALYVAGAGYLVDAFLTMVVPDVATAAGPVFMATATAEVPVIFWLAWWGTRRQAEAPTV